MSGRELRRDERIDVSQKVWVEGQDIRISAQAMNISKGGMFVVTDQRPENLGSHVEITFDDPEEGRVTLAMEVVWKREDDATGQLGLRTVDRDRADAFQRVVSRYLDNREAEESAANDADTTGVRKIIETP